MTTESHEATAAWRELLDTLRTLDASFMSGPKAVGDDRHVADGYRMLATTLGVAFDTYLFADPSRPRWLELNSPFRPDRRWGGDNTVLVRMEGRQAAAQQGLGLGGSNGLLKSRGGPLVERSLLRCSSFGFVGKALAERAPLYRGSHRDDFHNRASLSRAGPVPRPRCGRADRRTG